MIEESHPTLFIAMSRATSETTRNILFRTSGQSVPFLPFFSITISCIQMFTNYRHKSSRKNSYLNTRRHVRSSERGGAKRRIPVQKNNMYGRDINRFKEKTVFLSKYTHLKKIFVNWTSRSHCTRATTDRAQSKF